jgi:hypothetical protein
VQLELWACGLIWSFLVLIWSPMVFHGVGFLCSSGAAPGAPLCTVVEIEVSQRCALSQHSCKLLCPACADLIAAEIEVSQRCALRQDSC